jgi:hypothetical protein
MRNWLHKLPDRLLRRPLCALALSLVVAVTLPAAAQAASFKITPHIPNHTPIVNQKWPVELTVTAGKKRLSGSVKYEFLFEGSVVSHQPGHKFTRGIYRDAMVFPSQSLGQPLTVRMLVTVPAYHRTEHIDWAVKTKQATTVSTTTSQQ